MKKILAALTATALISGCSTTAPLAPLLKDTNKDLISRIDKVEIFYATDKPTISVVNLGTAGGPSQGLGLLGLLGPLGMIAAVAITSTDRFIAEKNNIPRSLEFTAKAQEVLKDTPIDEEYAHELANQFKAAGKTVKLSPIPTQTTQPTTSNTSVPAPSPSTPEPNANATPLATVDATPPQVSPPVGVVITPGYAGLFTAKTLAYGTATTTSSYIPLVLISAELKDDSGKLLAIHKITHREFSDSYFSYSKLLENTPTAVQALRTGYYSTASQVYQGLMVFSATTPASTQSPAATPVIAPTADKPAK